MTWDVAAGVLIGGILLAIMHYGFNTPSIEEDEPITERAYFVAGAKFVIGLLALGCAVWIVFFKAHWG